MTDKEKMFFENQKKNPPIGRSEAFADHHGKLLIRGGKKEKSVAEMKVMMIRVLAGLVKKKLRWLLVMI